MMSRSFIRHSISSLPKTPLEILLLSVFAEIFRLSATSF
nr:MAG TPA: hypothetical protein [Caudoviricetes sp.]